MLGLTSMLTFLLVSHISICFFLDIDKEKNRGKKHKVSTL